MLRVLVVEDSMDDALLLRRELRRAGYEPTVRLVADAGALRDALAEAEWDLVLCDFVIPGLDVIEALEIVKESGQDLPVIVVSGRVGEDEAASALKAGAHDFVTKERLSRLVPAIERELREAADRARRRQAEQALRDSEERHRLLVESIQDYAICLLNAEGKISSWNGGAAQIFGYKESEVRGKHIGLLFRALDETQALPAQILEVAARAGVYESEVWCQHRDGSDLLANVVIRAVHDETGALSGYTMVCRDITEQMRLAEEQIQSQKLEVIGRLAGSVAHDFNNLLTVVSGFAELLMPSVQNDENQRVYVDEITKAAGQAASLTQQLLAFGRRQLLQPRVIDLNEIVQDMETMLRRLIGENLELETHLDANPSHIHADMVQIQQALMNLVINARDAMPDRGTVTITTGNAEDTAAGPEAPPLVTLSVSDTGHGMDKETLSRIFEPFFSTKEVGKGAGLGLATVDGIVAQSGGRITVSSEPEKGTTFTILLPATQPTPAAPGVAAPTASASPTGSETILLVEDEAALRRLSRRILAQFGYTVIEANNGAEALQLAEEYRGPIHLVLTDVVMPQVSGPALAECIRLSHPEAKILFMSGYTDDAVLQHGLLSQEVFLLRKPFTPYALAARTREVLDSTA